MMSQDPSSESVDVLFVEDNPGDVRLAEEAFKEIEISVDLESVHRGQNALEYLHERYEREDESRPDVILLDLHLPDMDGMEILEELKETQGLESIPVIVLTNSQDVNHMSKSLEKDALAYFAKPFDPDGYDELAHSLASFFIDIAYPVEE
ncbi:response regulator [Haloferax sp. DFSO52]|uniref:response regulator n=1 Tax=Haloferax sp. DFSO52 TaxID=3388505 RepID=UPI003A89D0C1